MRIEFEMPSSWQRIFFMSSFDSVPDEIEFLCPTTKSGAPVYTFCLYSDLGHQNYASAVLRGFLTKKGTFLISYIKVGVGRRRLGYAEALIKHVTTLFKPTYVKQIECHTRAGNDRMQSLLGKLEFEMKQSPTSYKNGELKMHHTLNI